MKSNILNRITNYERLKITKNTNINHLIFY